MLRVLVTTTAIVAMLSAGEGRASAGGLPTVLQAALDHARLASGTPGASAAIIVDGRLIWSGTSGTVDLRTHRPVAATTMYPLASVSKLFTDAMVLRLAEEGKLGLDQPIARYVPAYVPDAGKVSVKELLGHTSGYPDVEDDPTILRSLADPNHAWSREQLMRKETTPTFAPGTRFAYCNSCFVMLGAVIESAAGDSVDAEFDRLIVRPLGLASEVDLAVSPAVAPEISRGYDFEKGKLVDTFAGARVFGVPTFDWGPIWTDGGVAATAIGAARFTDALMGGRVLRPATLATMLHTGPDRNHGLDAESYAFDRHVWRGHSGYYDGFTAESWHDFGRRLTVTVCANRTDDADPATEIWNALAKAYDRADR